MSKSKEKFDQTDLPAEIEGTKSLGELRKMMRSYIAAGDFDLLLSEIFPPIDRKSEVALLSSSITNHPLGMTIASAIDQISPELEFTETSKIEDEGGIEEIMEQPTYLITEDGTNYHYALLSAEKIQELLGDGEEYILIR